MGDDPVRVQPALAALAVAVGYLIETGRRWPNVTWVVTTAESRLDVRRSRTAGIAPGRPAPL
ncbi:hypothetical protein ABIA32_003371 [Streptacidiphilus sp. MAP12-20]